jgi:hypothetical protein
MTFLEGHTVVVGLTLLAVSFTLLVFGIGILVGNSDKKEQNIQPYFAQDERDSFKVSHGEKKVNIVHAEKLKNRDQNVEKMSATRC